MVVENAALFGEKAVAAADEKDAKGGSLMDHVMRPSDVHGGDAGRRSASSSTGCAS